MQSKAINEKLEEVLEDIEERDEISLHIMRRANELADKAYIELSCNGATQQRKSKDIHREILQLTDVIAKNAELRLENAMVCNRLIAMIMMDGL